MRISRSVQLYEPSAFVHKFWRCHNRESYLETATMKQLYLNCVKEALKSELSSNSVFIHAYCAMSNHFHKLMSYQNGSKNLSNFMRQAHGLFGARYNRIHKRSGKVAEGRPKTPLIENGEHIMRVHFYVEANPIRAGTIKLENLQLYKFSSYGFYAYGKRNEYTDMLVVPDWYLELGQTARERQEEYRKLFAEYVESRPELAGFIKTFIGSQGWLLKQLDRIRAEFRKPQKHNTAAVTDTG